MVTAETGPLQRAGLLLLIGLAADRSDAAISALTGALAGEDPLQRRGATLAVAYLKPDPLPTVARAAVMDAISTEDLESCFDGLPWDVSAEVDRAKLYACLDPASHEEAAIAGIVVIEAGKATHQTISTVLDLIFPLRPPRRTAALTDRDLSPLQRRAVRAMASAVASGRRIFYGHFPLWGLPDTAQGWRTLASSKPAPDQ